MTAIEKLNRKRKQWRAASQRYIAAHKSKISVRKKLAYRRDPSKAIAAARAWQFQNPDRVKQSQKLWKLKNRKKGQLLFTFENLAAMPQAFTPLLHRDSETASSPRRRTRARKTPPGNA